MGLDLDAILAVADGYEERKKKAREWHIQNDIATDEDHLSRLATFRADEAAKAFEALRPLVERVRELERQNKELGVWNYEFQREARKLQFQLEQVSKEAGK